MSRSRIQRSYLQRGKDLLRWRFRTVFVLRADF
jgi:hypothetical protein